MEAEITYLANSGFAVKTGGRLLIFDCYSNTPVRGKTGLADVITDAAEIEGESVYVFVSHAHSDHYNPMIFNWAKRVKDIAYILSDDIKRHAGALMVSPDSVYEIDGMRIETLKSTDEGVAFLITFDGITIYHAGDLNWWHWEGEDPAWNRQMATDYKAEIEKLKGCRIDIAFVPIDPRLGDSLYLGTRLLLETADVGVLIPMHYGSDAAAVERLISSGKLPESQKRKISAPMKRGESILIRN